jgi:hypothetical protein
MVISFSDATLLSLSSFSLKKIHPFDDGTNVDDHVNPTDNVYSGRGLIFLWQKEEG